MSAESSPKVSVVLLTYNHARWIGQALDGVLSQTTDFDFEVIVTEDCSTDGTRELILERARNDKRIRTLFSPVNMNNMEVEARAFRAARGEYVAFLEGDDYWTFPQKLERQVRFLEANPECASCFHNARILLEDGTFSERLYCRSGQKARLDVADILLSDPIPTCSIVFRRRVLQSLPAWYYEMPVGDWTLNLICALHGRIGYIDGVWAVYRRHSGGLWSGQDLVAQAQLCLDWRARVHEATGRRYRRAIRRGQAREYRRLAQVHAESGAVDLARAAFLRLLGCRVLAGPPPSRDEARLGLKVFAPRLARWLEQRHSETIRDEKVA